MHLPALILDLAVILGVAAIVTFIFRRLRQPVVLGYICAGIIVGPYTPPFFSVSDIESVKVWAELGVIFLMFTLGLEFSFRRLAKVGMSAGVTATIQIFVMLICGLLIAKLLGWSKIDAIFLGCMIAISSTTIIIKALEELGFKTKKFAELVFGILIVEDLAAIIMLVALSNIALTSQFGGLELVQAGGKLVLVVGSWFLIGMFVIPKFIRLVAKHGNNEMLTVVSIALCLGLVAVASHFNYSIALGAFIMGSILAESSEAKKIEHLVEPLKDIFGAVFFVSVGMLLDPRTLVDNLGAVALLSFVIIFGKLATVSFGALISGQTLKTSIQTGFSMAQIGEFSFIIATLGLTYGVINEKIYPIIVASSLITTFTTPYLIKCSNAFSEILEKRLPTKFNSLLNNYVLWIQRNTSSSEYRQKIYSGFLKWALNALVVILLFVFASFKLVPILNGIIQNKLIAKIGTWSIAVVLSSPSIWAMLSAFRFLKNKSSKSSNIPQGGAQILAQLATVSLIGLLSMSFFPAFITFVGTLGVFSFVFIFFKRQIGAYYRFMEMQFKSGFQADLSAVNQRLSYERLAPWDAHLVEVKVPSRSFISGRLLKDLSLREKYGVNIVVIVRDGENIVAPQATEPIYPGDQLLCFATDNEIETFKNALSSRLKREDLVSDLENYDMRRFKIQENSKLNGVSIKDSEIREQYNCIIVGMEKNGTRISSPQPNQKIDSGDFLWVIGDMKKLQEISTLFG
ncbi:MAG: cation:proton antiporter [Oligoflexales bacterium]|nr:cation:proton antiporter [Oligoflexales bacterium]